MKIKELKNLIKVLRKSNFEKWATEKTKIKKTKIDKLLWILDRLWIAMALVEDVNGAVKTAIENSHFEDLNKDLKKLLKYINDEE